MVCHVWKINDNDILNDFLILVKRIFKRIDINRFGAEVTADFVKIIAKFVEVNLFLIL